MITLQIDTFEEFMDDFNFNEWMDTEKNREYLKRKFEEIKTNEIECLETSINDASDALQCARIINDNRGTGTATDDNGEEIGEFNYRADVAI